MTDKQQTIEKSAPEDMGIRCYVRCTSNKIDTAKDNVRSINFNFDLRDEDDNMIGAGNNLNINNITPEAYEKMCKAFGVEDVTPDTPFYASLITLFTQEKIIAWRVSMDRKDKKIDKDQSDITEDPDTITEKQMGFIAEKFAGEPRLDDEIKKYLKDVKAKGLNVLNKSQASELILTLKEIAEEVAKAPKKTAKKDK